MRSAIRLAGLSRSGTGRCRHRGVDRHRFEAKPQARCAAGITRPAGHDAETSQAVDHGARALPLWGTLTLDIVDALLQYPIDGLHLYPVYWESYMPELATEIRQRAKKAGHKIKSS